MAQLTNGTIKAVVARYDQYSQVYDLSAGYHGAPRLLLKFFGSEIVLMPIEIGSIEALFFDSLEPALQSIADDPVVNSSLVRVNSTNRNNPKYKIPWNQATLDLVERDKQASLLYRLQEVTERIASDLEEQAKLKQLLEKS